MSELVFGWQTSSKRAPMGFVNFTPSVAESPAMITDSGDGHALVIAPTGGGKSRSIAIPNLLWWDGPAIVVDVKGELAHTTANYRRSKLGQHVIILDPWSVVTPYGDSLNPIDRLAGCKQGLEDACFEMATNLITGQSLKEPFWEERAGSLLAGMMAFIVTLGMDSRGMGRLYEMLHGDDPIYAMACLLDQAKMAPFPKGEMAGFLATADLTRSGILSTARNGVRIYASKEITDATHTTSFDLEAVTRGDPMTIYIVVQPSKLVSHGSLIRLWLTTLLAMITQRTQRPERPTLFMIDEAAQLGPMPQIQSAITLTRSYGMRCMLMLQSYSQLRSMYPLDHETVLENCANLVTFGHTSRTMSAQVAAAVGDISADELYGMPRNGLAVRSGGHDTRIARKIDYLTDSPFRERASPNPMFARGR